MLKKLFSTYPIIREVLLYGIIGAVSAAFDSGFYYVFTRFLFVHELVANFISVNIGITISFLLNTYVNFRKTDKLQKRAISFYSVGYAGLGLSTLLLYIGVHFCGFNDFAVKLVSIFIVAAFQFVLNKFVTYGKIK